MPADLPEAGITDTTGLQYTPDTVAGGFCLTAAKGEVSVNIGGLEGNVNAPTSGPCLGHNGTVPGADSSSKLSSGKTCPANYVVVPGSSVYGTTDFCIMKYEAKIQGDDDGATTYSDSMIPDSRASGTPWANISQTNALAASKRACSSCHLATEAEWMTLAANIMSVPNNWSGDAVGTGYIYQGHVNNNPTSALAADPNDANGLAGITGGTGTVSGTNSRRTLILTNGQVIWDLSGNIAEWTSQTIAGNQPGAPGYTSRQYTDITDLHGISTSSLPSSVSSAAAGWNSEQGIGKLYSSTDETAVHAYLRSGVWGNTVDAGVLYLALHTAPSSTSSHIGFRVVSLGD